MPAFRVRRGQSCRGVDDKGCKAKLCLQGGCPRFGLENGGKNTVLSGGFEGRENLGLGGLRNGLEKGCASVGPEAPGGLVSRRRGWGRRSGVGREG